MKPFLIDNLRFVLKGKKILLGITGSIAAFKACDIVRHLRACGAEVRIVLTQGAENFVTRTTLETLSGHPVLSGFWNESQSLMNHGTHHIDTARWADLVLIAPATAHFIGKMAHGLADDLLSTEILAFRGPVFVAPAMNPAMFSHPAVQVNIQTLKTYGVNFLGPTQGLTSCGEEGLGRMLEPEQIIEGLSRAFYAPALRRKMVITLGPTRSSLDPVRYITNRSSGLMGAAICWAGVQAGYAVTAICGPTDAQLPADVEVIRVQTAKEMERAALDTWTSSSSPAHIFVATAAVLDWDISHPATSKLKKENGVPQFDLIKNPDILAEACKRKRADQFILGFAAETQNPQSYALEKLSTKNCNAIFANDVSSQSAGFECDWNGGWWITAPQDITEIPRTTKTELARHLVMLIQRQERS